MITVLHGGGVSNDYGTPWILGCYIRNINSRDLKKIKFLSVGKKSFLGGMSKLLQLYRGGYGEMITVLHRGDRDMPKWLQYYMGGGSLRTPKSDYVICARPLIGVFLRRDALFIDTGKLTSENKAPPILSQILLRMYIGFPESQQQMLNWTLIPSTNSRHTSRFGRTPCAIQVIYFRQCWTLWKSI